MRPVAWKEIGLDGLLAALVVTSLVLSWQVWYRPDRFQPAPTAVPTVQPQPMVSERQMPEIYRPEVILVRMEGNRIAPLHTGALAYKQLWPKLRLSLSGLRSTGGAFQVDQVPERLTQGPWVQLWLPSPLLLSYWADLWSWNMPTLRNGAMRIDRVTIYLGEAGAVYLSGPSGSTLYLADLSEERRADFLELVATLDPSLFLEYRPLDPTELGAQLEPDLLVPVIDRLPLAQVRVERPDEQDEEARYFPDTSVVRQLVQRDARSLTDGQRILTFTASGLLEYRTADPSSLNTAPDMQRAIGLVQEWVGARGGWPQELVLRRYVQQPGRARLEFDFRTGGPFPVESVGSAMQVHVSSQRVLFFSQYPVFVEMRFNRDQMLISSPEAAVKRARREVSLLLTESIRSMHLAYMAMPDPQDLGAGWLLEPAWVLHAGEARLYVPAATGRDQLPVQVIR